MPFDLSPKESSEILAKIGETQCKRILEGGQDLDFSRPLPWPILLATGSLVLLGIWLIAGWVCGQTTLAGTALYAPGATLLWLMMSAIFFLWWKRELFPKRGT